MRFLPSFIVLEAALLVASASADITPEKREFFEGKIRPVLATECYECHSMAGKQRGGLVLDHRAATLEGGDSGVVLVPGDPQKSLLITAIRHDRNDLKMPKAGVKLSPQVIRDFEEWIAMGAPDPRDAPPSAEEIAAVNDWDRVMEQRKQWWSFLPVEDVEIPEGTEENPVDRFLSRAQREASLKPAALTDRRTLIRRLSFVLTGLPPQPSMIDSFERDSSPSAYTELVDAMLESSEFGERWARHWMDWFRYAETHGSEGDPRIPFAWRYRDYLIRTLNEDVPYDQLVREHIAGDLLESPRVVDGHNESAMGIAHFRMVQHGFAPTDALDEMVRFTDNQIDVITKGFLGLTVSCARCHNHKFDAISQADFYALFGIMTSSRPATLSADIIDMTGGQRTVMQRMKELIRERLSAAWSAEEVKAHLLKPEAPWQSAIENATQPGNPLHAWNQLADKEGEEFRKGWESLKEAWKASVEQLGKQNRFSYENRWRLKNSAEAGKWVVHGTGAVSGKTHPAGEFHLQADGEQVVGGIFPGGLLSHALTSRDSAVFNSPNVMLDGKTRVFVKAAGSSQSIVRYAVRHYPRDGTVYPVGRMNDGKWRWYSWDLSYWDGDSVHVEVATAADSPVLGRANVERSWAAVSDVIFVKEGQPQPEEHFAEYVSPLFERAAERMPASIQDLAEMYSHVVRECVDRWGKGMLSDAEARFLDYFVSMDLLPNTLDGLPSVAPLVAEFRELEKHLDSPVRTPGVVEAEPVMQPLLERGDHKQPGAPVSRRFLDAFGAREYPEGSSGRLELAEDIIDSNPLAARMIVNRLWHHIFGQGIVSTPDNFGRLGKAPVHPQLLDFLAQRMRADGWSIKKIVKLLVSSQAFQRSSVAGDWAAERDPENQLLTHWRVRRLEAEAIRDSILSVSGQLESGHSGESVDGNSGKRSVYVRVIRNNLNPFLSVFDAPVPNSTQGVRDASNVPAQSLTMMNDTFVREAAQKWVQTLSAVKVEERIDEMFEKALGRHPTDLELQAAIEFIEVSTARVKETQARIAKVQDDLSRSKTELASIVDPVRERLLAAKGGGSSDSVDSGLPMPLAGWDFSEGIEDQIGSLDLILKGGATIENGRLKLNGSGAFAMSAPLQKPLAEKTLEVVVELANLNQRGGAALSVEKQGGGVFDAIVFAEREERKWMAGSNVFARTQDFAGGQEEVEAVNSPVCLTLVYRSDGIIEGYRNGEPYGKSYRASKLETFPKGDSRFLLGLRHSPSESGRWLSGAVHSARVYDRALTAEEVELSAQSSGMGKYVSERKIQAAMSSDQRQRYLKLGKAIENDHAALEALKLEDDSDPMRAWADLAHSILNLKEFIYLK